jgi:hypothetical protein
VTKIGSGEFGHKKEREADIRPGDVAVSSVTGLTYLLAFWSLYTQIPGLIGHDGILPAAQYRDRATQFVATEHVGLDRFRLLPTLCWLSAGDGFLRALCLAGAALASLLIAGILPAVMVPLLWIDYLSLTVVAREFFSYQ